MSQKCRCCLTFFVWNEIHGNRVHAVPNTLLSVTLTQENMSQMGTAPCTLNLCPNAIRIGQSLHRSGNLVVEAGPPAFCLKLAFRTVKRGTTPFATVASAFPE